MKHEKHMIKFVMAAVVVGLILAFCAIAVAQSLVTTCPYDGESASFTHTVGFGQQRVCWYAHNHIDFQAHTSIKHTFYQACPTN